MGLSIDEKANRQHAAIISSKDSRVKVQVMPTDEESVLAKQALPFVNETVQ